MTKKFSIKKLVAGVLAAAMVVTALPVSGLNVKAAESDTTPVYVLYDSNRGEHYFTADAGEKDGLLAIGWTEGNVAWTAPKKSNTPVYCLYNPNNGGDHYYTANASEKDGLLAIGWTEGNAKFYSDDAKGVLINTLYNPNAVARNHHYTASTGERDGLVALGWQDHTDAATAIYGVAESKASLSAKQTGSNTIVAVSGEKLSSTDKIVLMKGSTEQTITSGLSEDGKTITITTSTKIATDDYSVIVTPADTKKAQLKASFKGEAETLKGLKFGDELALISSSNFYSAQTTIKGANQWGEDFNLGSGEVKVYPSVAVAAAGAETAANAWDGATQTNYNAKTNVYTLVKGGTIPFQIGDKVNFTAIYTSGSTVIQETAELKVANVPYVSDMKFGELNTTNAKLKGKRVTVGNFRKGTYYIPVVAKDQYGNTLDADALNARVAAQSLFINPTAAQGAYGGYDDGEGFTTLDDGTVVMNVGAAATSMVFVK